MSSSAEPYDVYTGVWTNWSKGKAMGWTLTISRSNGNLLIAFVAAFVAFVGTRFWRILSFASHSAASSTKPRDGVYHQHQNIMRNTTTASEGCIAFIQVMWAWRFTTTRLWVGLILSALCGVGFMTASGFSSRISTFAGDEVLIRSTRCGILHPPFGTQDISMATYASLYMTHLTKSMVNAAHYAQECYGQNASGMLGCNTFVQKALPFTVDTQAPCPFTPGLCRTDSTNIRLDTGLLDSNDHLGLNAPPENRVNFRYVLQCAPLVTEGYRTRSNKTSIPWNREKGNLTYIPIVRYHYGDNIYRLHPALQDPKYALPANITYEYIDDFLWNPKFGSPGYTLSSSKAFRFNGSFLNVSDFEPLPDFTTVHPEADITLLFLSSNNLHHMHATTDEWFRATKRVRAKYSLPDLSGDIIPYVQEEPVSPLGCTEQWQYCRPEARNVNGKPRCTSLLSPNDIGDATIQLIEDDDTELNRYKWIHGMLMNPEISIRTVVSALKSEVLLARQSMIDRLQGPLPPNQWHLEVEHMFSTILSRIQQNAVRTVANPDTPGFDQFIYEPWDDDREMCQSQKVRSRAFTSFSLFGLLFIIILGSLIILVSFLLEPVTAALYRKGKYSEHAYYEWVSTSAFQLQRLAHQAVGAGTWTRSLKDIPTTKRGEKLAQLDFSDPSTPLLVLNKKPADHVSSNIDSTSTLAGKNTDDITSPWSHTVSPISPGAAANTRSAMTAEQIYTETHPAYSVSHMSASEVETQTYASPSPDSTRFVPTIRTEMEAERSLQLSTDQRRFMQTESFRGHQ